jgi:hypothetical protein
MCICIKVSCYEVVTHFKYSYGYLYIGSSYILGVHDKRFPQLIVNYKKATYMSYLVARALHKIYMNLTRDVLVKSNN